MPVLPATVRHVLAAAARRIDPVDAEWLLLHVLGQTRGWLFAHDRDALTPEQFSAFEALVARRETGEPVAYLTGRRGFWTLDLEVNADTLIPRAETELLVELALQRIPTESAVRIADLGTGSGAIALALASERPAAQVMAVDVSEGAATMARANAARLGLGNVEVRSGSWFAPLVGERFDLIVSNPPYIAAQDPHLQQGDLRFEPLTALASGADGLDDLRHIVSAAPSHLVRDGWLLLEHGHDQGDAVRALMAHAGFARVATQRDLEGRDRVSLGQWPRG